MKRRRAGFSLLEVILALAILAGAVAVLGEAARHAMRNAQTARDLTHAQLLCESRMSEITAGLAPLEATEGNEAALPDVSGTTETADEETSPESDWLYSVDVQPIDEEGLVAVRVTVTRNTAPEQRGVEFSLVRWMVDTAMNQSQTGASGLAGTSANNEP